MSPLEQQKSIRLRFTVDINDVIVEIDDPNFTNPISRIDRELQESIFSQRCIGDLYQ